SISSSVVILMSNDENNNEIPTPTIPTRTTAIAMFNIGFGATGEGSSPMFAFVNTLTLSTCIISRILSWNVSTVVLAMSTAKLGFSSVAVTVTTCEFSSLDT